MGVRRLTTAPAEAILVVAVLAIGIGMNAAAYSLLDATLLHPLPYTSTEQLVELHRGQRQRWYGDLARADLEIVRAGAPYLYSVAAYRERFVIVAIGDATTQVLGAEITPNLLSVLDVAPRIGRPLLPGDVGVVIIGHRLWERAFGSNTGALGQTIRVDGVDRVVVGVMPAGFHFYQGQELWLPMAPPGTAAELAPEPDDSSGIVILGRLAAGVTIEHARARLPALAAELDAALPAGEQPEPLVFVGLEEGWLRRGEDTLGVLLQAAAGLLLIVVTANVGGVLLVRGLAQQREIGVRRALGASGGRIVRLVVAECSVLVAIAGAVGLLIAPWIYRGLVSMFPDSTLRLGLERGFSPGAVLPVLAMSGLVVVWVGLLPARALTHLDLRRALHRWGAGTTAPAGTRRWQARLSGAQVALAIILLVGVGLTVRSLAGVRRVEPGFDARRVVRVWLGAPEGSSPEQTISSRDRLVAAFETLPQVQEVALEGFLPEELRRRPPAPIETRVGPSELWAYNLGRAVPPEYFTVMGLPLVSGRRLTAADAEEDAAVAVISEEAAQRIWPGTPGVLGREFRFPGTERWWSVVGVVGNVVRIQNRRPGQLRGNELLAEPWPDIYIPIAGSATASPSTLLVRTTAGTAEPQRALVRAAAVAAPGVSVEMRTLWDLNYGVRGMVFDTVARLLAAFGAAILVVSALGIHGVLAHASSQRVREFGIRMALGATRQQIRRSVLWQGQRLAATGVVIGGAISFVLYRLARGLLFGVGSGDPVTYAGVAIVVMAAAVTGALGPARRATSSDPVDALRSE